MHSVSLCNELSLTASKLASFSTNETAPDANAVAICRCESAAWSCFPLVNPLPKRECGWQSLCRRLTISSWGIYSAGNFVAQICTRSPSDRSIHKHKRIRRLPHRKKQHESDRVHADPPPLTINRNFIELLHWATEHRICLRCVH